MNGIEGVICVCIWILYTVNLKRGNTVSSQLRYGAMPVFWKLNWKLVKQTF